MKPLSLLGGSLIGVLLSAAVLLSLDGCRKSEPEPSPSAPVSLPARLPAGDSPESEPVMGPLEPPSPPPPPEPATPPPTEEERAGMWENPVDQILPSDEDVAALRQEVKDHGGSPEAHYRLGQALQRRGQRAEAEAEFRETLRLDPRHAKAQAALRSLQGVQ